MADGEATQAREPARQGCQLCRTSVLTMADGSAHIARAGPGRGRGAGRPGTRLIPLRGWSGGVRF